MNRHLIKAAKDLYELVSMPIGTYNVIPLHDTNGNHLEVWIDKQYIRSVTQIPSEYKGFAVIVKPRPTATAQLV